MIRGRLLLLIALVSLSRAWWLVGNACADEPAATKAVDPKQPSPRPSPVRGEGEKASGAEARRLFLTGNYEEAREMFHRLGDQQPVDAALGEARCLAAVGKSKEAIELLQAAIAKVVKADGAGGLHAELALLALEAGDDHEATRQCDAALAVADNSLTKAEAGWVQAELHRRAGRLDKAEAAYKSLVDLYNAAQDDNKELSDSDTLRYIGLAAAQFARWRRNSEQFHFLVNDLYPDALTENKQYWPAHFEMGRLYLEKFNQADAAAEFKAALAINPQAAEVHAALAELALQNYELTEATASIDRALKINPRLLWAKQLQADVQLANFEPARAIELLEDALKLDPHDEDTLGRLAAAYAALDGVPADLKGTRLGKLIDEATARNPHAGEFFLALGDGLDKLRRYPDCARFYREAIAHMSQLVAPRGQLGLVLMRLGDEVEAGRVLRESFDIDPFNVRVSNTLKVLDVLANYAVIETDHFIVKFDRAHDELLGRYAARYLEEEVYPQLVAKFGFKPEGKSLFEIFSRAKNTNGHGWFSARMVGLPYVGTVGACAGRMVAMQSPDDGLQRFNWARVLRHEFVHVVNLQQTHFNIPHWFTEALAVQNEGYPRPQKWNELLLERVPKGKLFDLQTINTGFIRPKSSDEWALAYCQAELYADYMLDRFGKDAISKMLAAYATNLNTTEAIHRSFGIDEPDFERGYGEYLKKIVAGLGQGGAAEKQPPEIERNGGAKAEVKQSGPGEVVRLKKLAAQHLKAGENEQLFKVLEQLAAIEPDDVLIRKKLASLALASKDFAAAEHWAKQGLYVDVNDVDSHRMLAEGLAGRQEYAAAVEEYATAVKLEPLDLKLQLALADAQMHAGKSDAARKTLDELLKRQADFPGAADLLKQLDSHK